MKLQLNKKQQVYLESIALGAILITAIVLRTYKLGHWGLEGDELNTLRDSLTTSSLISSRATRPLLFFLNYHLLASWTTLDEISLRVFPAVFGIASVLAVYWFARRTINSTTALLAAVLVVIAPGHLYWSQYARYYTLAYLLTIIFSLASYLAIDTQKIRWYIVALFCVGLAWLAHPSTALVMAAIAAWALWQLKSRQDIVIGDDKFWVRTRAVLVLLVVGLAASLLWLPMLLAVRHSGEKWGYEWIHLTLGHIDAVSPGIFACGLAGMLCLWMTGQRRLATMMAAIAFIPLLLMLVLCNWVAVTQGYLFVSTFVFLIGTAYLLDRLATKTYGWNVQRLAAAILLTLLLLEAAPKIWSHYCDGGRPDFRAASLYVRDHAGEHDKVLADQERTVGHYLKNVPIARFRRTRADLTEAWSEMCDQNQRANLWIIAQYKRRGGFNDKDLGPLKEWINTNGHMVASFSQSRLDYKHNEVRVYLLSQHAHEHNVLPDMGSAN